MFPVTTLPPEILDPKVIQHDFFMIRPPVIAATEVAEHSYRCVLLLLLVFFVPCDGTMEEIGAPFTK